MNIHEDFLKIINLFQYNKIVMELNNLFNNPEVKSDYDYIKISDSNKFINFLSTKKVEEITDNCKHYTVNAIKNLTHSDQNDRIFNLIGYDKSINTYWYPQPGNIGTIENEVVSEKTGKTYVLFKCTESGKLSVINKVAVLKSFPNLFTESKNRLKIGRFITHLLEQNEIDANSSEIEEFVNLYKSTFDIIGDKFLFFELVSGDSIPFWYPRDKYQDDNGSLGGSCMHNVDSEYFDIYSKNKNCKMLILKSQNGVIKNGVLESNTICGRALVWNAKLIQDGVVKDITFMDRVYYNNDSDVDVFKSYAKENGWWYKTKQNYYPEIEITNGTESVEFDDYTNRLEVELDQLFFNKYPYIDTFCYIKDENTLTNSYQLDEKLCVAHGFRSTSGNYETYRGDNSIKPILTDNNDFDSPLPTLPEEAPEAMEETDSLVIPRTEVRSLSSIYGDNVHPRLVNSLANFHTIFGTPTQGSPEGSQPDSSSIDIGVLEGQIIDLILNGQVPRQTN